MMRKYFCKSIFFIFLLGTVSACSEKNEINQSKKLKQKQARALAIFLEYCKSSGVKVNRTVDGVDGIFIMRARSKENFDNQFEMDDPYGRDLTGEGYIGSFLRGNYQAQIITKGELKSGDPQHVGFLYADAIDEVDGKRYRYTGSIREYEKMVGDISGPKKKSVTTGYMVDRILATDTPPRYGVTYSDISTMEDREFWIAGSSLKVVDMKTKDIVAERIGYMMDLQQGSQVGFRSPWLFAASNACPSFRNNSSFNQIWQTEEFVEYVLKPKK